MLNIFFPFNNYLVDFFLQITTLFVLDRFSNEKRRKIFMGSCLFSFWIIKFIVSVSDTGVFVYSF